MDRDIDRFVTLFLPATPPASPSLTPTTTATTDIALADRRRSTDSDFGAFVSVPASQDPLASDSDAFANPNNHSLGYFDKFTRIAAERSSNRDVLDELLAHQDDPMYFLNLDRDTTPTDDALADALASEMANTKLIRDKGHVRVAPSPSRSRVPLPPHLSGTMSPPSTSSTPDPAPSLSSSSKSMPHPQPNTNPAHATLSRLASFLPTRPRSTTPISPITHTRTSTSSSTLTHGSPFASTPYIPPTGAPGFAGDRAWDRGFSDALVREEKLGLVDPIGLGIGAGTEMTASVKHGKTHKGVVFVGRWQGTARVLSEEIADLIRPHLPALTRLPRHWTLLYSLDQHGISLNTLYARCEPRVPSRGQPNPPQGGLLVIQDAHDAIFGAWSSEGVKLEKGGYYGSGESFLWRYHSPVDGERQGRLDVYPWTGKNAYVSLCEPGFISFGGGDGHYGLYIDASLLEGSSAACPTFGNPPLCGASSHGGKARADVSFECVGLEVWGIGSG